MEMIGFIYRWGLILQAVAIVHFVQRRPDTFWLWIILMGGGLGALVYIVVAEQYGAATGLGYLSSVAAQRFQMAAMFVPIIIIAGLGAGLNETLKAIETRLDKWKPQRS